MSKLIVEMEMPSSCAECPVCDYEGADCLLADDRNTLPHNGTRPSWCPIKGVLPDEHGRLIDADAYQYYGDLADEPTIVPSTRKEKNDEK